MSLAICLMTNRRTDLILSSFTTSSSGVEILAVLKILRPSHRLHRGTEVAHSTDKVTSVIDSQQLRREDCASVLRSQEQRSYRGTLRRTLRHQPLGAEARLNRPIYTTMTIMETPARANQHMSPFEAASQSVWACVHDPSWPSQSVDYPNRLVKPRVTIEYFCTSINNLNSKLQRSHLQQILLNSPQTEQKSGEKMNVLMQLVYRLVSSVGKHPRTCTIRYYRDYTWQISTHRSRSSLPRKCWRDDFWSTTLKCA